MSPAEGAFADLGFLVPGWTLRGAFAILAVGLCFAEGMTGFWLGVALLLAAVSIAVPRWLTAWFLIGVLSFTVLLRAQSLGDWRPYLLISGAHALHLLASWMLVVSPRAKMQPASLWPSTRRFLLIQLPVQGAAAAAFTLATAASGAHIAALAAVAGVGVLGVTVALAAPLLRRLRS